MPTVTFTSALTRHVGALPRFDVTASTVGQALDQVFVEQPKLRSYVLEDGGAVRQHVAVFVDGVSLHDRKTLADAVGHDTEIHVLQALSGG